MNHKITIFITMSLLEISRIGCSSGGYGDALSGTGDHIIERNTCIA